MTGVQTCALPICIVALDAVAAEMEVESVRPVFNMAINADKKRERGMHRWFVVEFAEDTPVESVAQRYAAMNEVERVEYAMEFARPEVNVVPVESLPATRSGSEPFNDPMLPLQWGLHNEGSSTIFSTAYAGAPWFSVPSLPRLLTWTAPRKPVRSWAPPLLPSW